MKPFFYVSMLSVLFLTSCGVQTGTPAGDQPSATSTRPADSATFTASPTQVPPTPTATPTEVVLPADFRSDNFQQFVRVQSFVNTIEAVVGKSIFDMRLDAVAYSPDGRYVAVGGCTGNWNGGCINDVWGGASYLLILDARTAEIVAVLPETKVTVASLAFSPDGERLIYAVNPVRVVIWDIAAGKVERVLWQANDGGYTNVGLSPDGSQIAAVDKKNLRVWDAVSGELLVQKPAYRYGRALPMFSEDGSRLAVYSPDSLSKINIFDTQTWDLVTSISLPNDEDGAMAFSPDFKLLATSGKWGDLDIRLWDVETGAQTGTLKNTFWYGVDSLSFTPDSRLILASGMATDALYEHPFRVWDASTHEDLGTKVGPDSYAYLIQFSRDGKSFLTWDDFGVSLWSFPDQKILDMHQAFLDFNTALNLGDYGTAAGFYQLAEWETGYFASQGVDTTDLPALLEFFCLLDAQPCMPVREVLYAGMDDYGYYSLLVSFTAPDGSVYMDENGYTTFWMTAEIQPDGKVIFNTLPPFPIAP